MEVADIQDSGLLVIMKMMQIISMSLHKDKK